MIIACLLANAAFAANVDSVPAEFPTIQDAIDRGTSPVIEVAPGNWQGAVVTRAVVIHGADGAVIVGGPKVGGNGVGFALDARGSGSEIVGFDFACAASRNLDFGVYSSTTRFGSAAHDVRVADNTFQGCVQGVTDAGVATDECRPKTLSGGRYWLVENNTFDGMRSTTHTGLTGGGMGVFLFNSRDVDVVNNDFTGKVQDRRDFTTGGVVLAGCWDCTIQGNSFAVAGATGYYSAISNFGYYQSGAAASQRLFVADNDASRDSAPHLDESFRSYDSYDVELHSNSGVAFIDHTTCGDDRLETWGTPASAVKPAVRPGR